MIGIIIAAHAKLSYALIEAAEFIKKKSQPALLPLSVNIEDEPTDKIIKKIQDGIKKVNRGSGVLILTDMFGGTPSNISYSFLQEGTVEVLSGVNLPILIRAIDNREKMKLNELADSIEAFGKKSISLASGILKGNKRDNT
ncbi:MAG: PTS fructose transporter subunit IIA [Deltaproteobacteria bacterium]|nr:PTS fructose transporter subunit IIA [Deltaproteobacteria bacterium]